MVVELVRRRNLVIHDDLDHQYSPEFSNLNTYLYGKKINSFLSEYVVRFSNAPYTYITGMRWEIKRQCMQSPNSISCSAVAQ